jgi:hypothetical protein
MTAHLVRAVKWTGFVAVAAAASIYLAMRVSAGGGPQDALTTMRGVTALLALGCCAALDDPAAPVLAACPTPLRRRRAEQAAVTLVPAVLLWVIALTVTTARAGASAVAAGLLVEGAALLAFIWTVGLVAQRFGLHEPGAVAGAITLPVLLVVTGLPHSTALLTGLDDPAWHASHQRTTAVLAVLIGLALIATRDPAAHRIEHFREPPGAEPGWQLTDE